MKQFSALTSTRVPVSDISNQTNINTNQNNFNIIGGVHPNTPSKLKLNLFQKQTQQLQNQSPTTTPKHNFRPRSNTVRNELGQIISLKKLKTSTGKQNEPTNSKTLSTKKFATNSSMKSSLLSSPKPSQFKTLVQENKKLKDNILMLTKLIQEVVPVFSQMSQQNAQINNLKQEIKSPKQSQKSQSQNTNHSSVLHMDQIFGSIGNKSRMMTQEQLTFLQQSLQQLQSAYEQKQTDEGGCFTDQDSDFMDAEDIDLGSIDEKTVNQNSHQQDHQKQSFLTFGGHKTEPDCSQNLSLRQNQQQPLLTGQRINSNSTQKTKISDLNKQGKNYNMPVCLDSVRSKKKIIDYEGVKQLQGMIDNINKSEILQELKLIQPYSSLRQTQQDETCSRNQILQSNYSSANISGDSSISDDDLSSIPTDSLLNKNIVKDHQTISKQNLLYDLNSQPFNKFSLGNLQQKYHNNLIDQKNQSQKLQNNKVGSVYPKIIPLTTQNFNSLTSVESYEDNDNHNLYQIIDKKEEIFNNIQQTIDSSNTNKTEVILEEGTVVVAQETECQQNLNFQDTQIYQQFIEQEQQQQIIQTTNGMQYEVVSNNQIEIFDQQNQSSQISQVNIEVPVQEAQNQQNAQNVESNSNQEEQNKVYSEQQQDQKTFEIDNQGLNNVNKCENYAQDIIINEPNCSLQQVEINEQVDDFVLQSQSKDCFMFTQSVVLTDQNIQHSKRGSVDPFLQQLMRNESPLKEKNNINDSIQQSERRDFGNALGFEDTLKSINITQELQLDKQQQQQLSQRKISRNSLQQSQSKKSLMNSSKKNKENVNEYEQKGQNTDSLQPPHQGIQVYQAQPRSSQQYSSRQSQVNNNSIPFKLRESLSNKQSGISSYNNSPQSSTKQNFVSQEESTFKRGKSISHHLKQNSEYYKTSHVNLQVIKSARPSFSNLQNRWNTIEEKEQNLVKINQEIIKRSQDQRQTPASMIDNLELANNINVFDISPQSQIKQTPQLAQHIGQVQDEIQDNLNFSQFNMTLTHQKANDNLPEKEETLKNTIILQPNVIQEKELVIENFSLQPIISQLNQSQNESSRVCAVVQSTIQIPFSSTNNDIQAPLNVFNQETQELSFNQTFNAFQKILEEVKNEEVQDTIQEFVDLNIQPKNITIEYQTDRTLRDKFIYEYRTHQKEQVICELDRLSTPSPRNIFEVLTNVPSSQQSIPQVSLSQQDYQTEIKQLETSMNKIIDINGSSIQEGNEIDGVIGTKEDITHESLTYKSSQFDKLMNDYLNDYGDRNRGSLSNASQSQLRTVSPNQQIRSQYSSGEFIEISAPDLTDFSSRKTLTSQNNNFTKASTVYEYQSTKNVSIEASHKDNDNVKIESQTQQPSSLSEIKVYDSLRTSSQSSAQNQLLQENSIIKEEPSFEEQESSNLNKYQKHNQSILQSQKMNLVQQQLTESQLNDTDSKVSLTNIDMAESEIFSNYLSHKSIKISEKDFKSDKSNQLNHNKPSVSLQNSTKNTPLKKYISIGSQSSQKTSPIIEEKCRTQRHMTTDVKMTFQLQTLKHQSELSSSILKPVLKQPRDNKSSQSRSPLKNCKPRDSISIDNSRTIEHESLTTAKLQIAREKREQIYKQKMDELQNKLDIKLSKITSLPSRQSIINQDDQLPSNRDTQQSTTRNDKSLSNTRINANLQIKKVPSSIFGSAVQQRSVVHPGQMQTIPIQDSKFSSNNAIQKRTQRDQSRQKELESKLQEKEQRIQNIISKKKEIDEKIQEQRLARELVQSYDKQGNEQPKQLSLTRGSLVLVRTPSKVLQQKMVLKKDLTTVKQKQIQNYNLSNSKQSNVLQQLTQNQSFKTIDVEAQSMSSLKHLNIESDQQNLDCQLIAPISERICTIQHKDITLSPILKSIQPTLKQKEFFQKIESDCHLRKQMKHHSRIEQISANKIKLKSTKNNSEQDRSKHE